MLGVVGWCSCIEIITKLQLPDFCGDTKVDPTGQLGLFGIGCGWVVLVGCCWVFVEQIPQYIPSPPLSPSPPLTPPPPFPSLQLEDMVSVDLAAGGKKKLEVASRYLDVIRHLRNLNNFESIFAIFSVLKVSGLRSKMSKVFYCCCCFFSCFFSYFLVIFYLLLLLLIYFTIFFSFFLPLTPLPSLFPPPQSEGALFDELNDLTSANKNYAIYRKKVSESHMRGPVLHHLQVGEREREREGG